LLASGESLAVGEEKSLQIEVVVDPGKTPSSFENQAIATATDPVGVAVSDRSQNGANPDPDGNGNPTNNSE